MKEKNLPVINGAIYFILVAFAFLLPVFYAPVTTEYFQFNKLALTAVVTFILITLWAVKMLIEGRVEVTKSPLNLPILLLLAAYIASSYFSINKFSSLYGSYGRWSNSLVVMALGTLLYFVVTANLKSKPQIKRILTAFIAGATVSSLVATLSYLGIKLLSASYAQIRNFTLTGSSLSAVSVSALAFILALGLLVDVRSRKYKILFAVFALLNFLPLALINELSAWAMAIAGLVAFLALTPADKVKGSNQILSMLAGVVLVSAVLLTIPAFKNALRLGTDYPRELKLDLRSSWVVTTASLRDFPFLGSGPSTFYLNFSHYRPLSLNSRNEAFVRFDKPFNEYLEVASTLGIVGFLLYLFLIYKAGVLAKHTDGSGTNAALSAAVIGIFVFFLLSYSSAMLTILLFAVLALLTCYAEGNYAHSIVTGMVETAVISFSVSGRSTNVTTKTVAFLFAIPLLLIVAAGSFFGVRAYAAEYMMRQSITAAQQNDAQRLFNAQRRAIALNPYMDTYHASFAQTNFVLANSIASNKKPEEITDEMKRNIQSLIAASIQETRVTTELLNPTSPAHWEQRGRIYSLLTGVAKDADSWAVGSYTRAIELDPTNPALRLSLGGVFYGRKDFANAERHFRAAVALKPDYANGHYNLAQALKAQNKFQEALTELQIVQRLVPKDSKDLQKVEGELTALRELPEVAGAQTNQPSVDELQQNTQPGRSNQEPLTEPGARQQPNISESTPSLLPR